MAKNKLTYKKKKKVEVKKIEPKVTKVKSKVKKVMKEYAEGKLHSGSKKGPVVTDKSQALAIGYSEAKEAKKKKKKKMKYK